MTISHKGKGRCRPRPGSNALPLGGRIYRPHVGNRVNRRRNPWQSLPQDPHCAFDARFLFVGNKEGARPITGSRLIFIHRHSLNLHQCRLRTTEDTTEDTASASSASPAIIPVIAVIAVIAAVALFALMTLASVLLIPLVAF